MKLTANSKIIFEKIVEANSMVKRAVGLLGKTELPENEAYYFPKCNAIHTCFMKFSIDCVFVNKEGAICKIYSDLKPWRFAGPVWDADSVFEMSAGLAKAKNLKVGDVIECGP